MSNQRQLSSQYPQESQHVAVQEFSNFGVDSSTGQCFESMARLASEVNGSIGFNPHNSNQAIHPFNGAGNFQHPNNIPMMAPFAPIQPSVTGITMGSGQLQGMDASHVWNPSLAPNHVQMHYQIPSNWTGAQMAMQSQGNQAILPHAAILRQPLTGSRKKLGCVITPLPEMATSGSSLVPPDQGMENPTRGHAAKRRPSIGSFSDADDSMEESTSGPNKVKQNRERNREHARSTRLRKKAYVQKLKEMADGLRSIQTEEIRQRRLAVHQMTEIQKTRKRLIQKFLHYHASYEKDSQAWSLLIEDDFWLKQPVTPFRAFRRSEVARDCRIVRGIEAIICDSASIATMVERIGSRNARWQRIKLRRFEKRIESSIRRQSMYSNQRVESSLSSSSSTDSSYDSATPRNNLPPPTNIEMTPDDQKVSSSSGDSSIGKQKRKRYNEPKAKQQDALEGQICSSSETEAEPKQKAIKLSELPSNIAGAGGIVHTVLPVLNSAISKPSCKVPYEVESRNSSPMSMNCPLANPTTLSGSRNNIAHSGGGFVHNVATVLKATSFDNLLTDLKSKRSHPTSLRSPLSTVQLKEHNAEEMGAYYAINEDDMIMIDDILMCPFVFRTKNAVHCGALADCVTPGMLRAAFSKNNKLQSLEMVYDAMGFMQQLDGANGGQVIAEVIPGSLEMALMKSPNEARIITEARPPFSVVHVNESWTRLTKNTQMESEGCPLLELLEGEQPDASVDANSGKLKHSLEEVAKGRSSCSTYLHHDKTGNTFVNFMCSYPLTNSDDEISHLLHVSQKLSIGYALI